MAIQKVAHVELRVDDLPRAMEFHTEVLGLIELDRGEDGTVYLGCGLDDSWDVALTDGGAGIAHVALDVTSAEDLDHYAGRLSELGVETERRTDGEPGQVQALRFSAPSGHLLELVVLEEPVNYLQVGAPRTPRVKGASPLDLDHVSVLAPDPRALADFLQEALDFKVSDVFEPAPGVWAAVWTRAGEQHHDIAMLGGPPGRTLHHVAWTMESFDHIKRGADYLAQYGLGLEVGPGRHSVGSNLFAYFQAPGGNRYEFSAEMARITNRAAVPGTWTELFPQGFSAWGHAPPETFQEGS